MALESTIVCVCVCVWLFMFLTKGSAGSFTPGCCKLENDVKWVDKQKNQVACALNPCAQLWKQTLEVVRRKNKGDRPKHWSGYKEGAEQGKLTENYWMSLIVLLRLTDVYIIEDSSHFWKSTVRVWPKHKHSSKGGAEDRLGPSSPEKCSMRSIFLSTTHV